MNKARLGQIEKLYKLVYDGSDYLYGSFESAEDEQAAGDLFDYQTAIDDAAYRMLSGFMTLQPQDKAALETPFLFGTRLLRIPEDACYPQQTHEIGHLEKVLLQAQNLEELRRICLLCMSEP